MRLLLALLPLALSGQMLMPIVGGGGAGVPVLIYQNFDCPGCTTGDQITAAMLNASSHGACGTWSLSGTTPETQTVLTAAKQTLAGPVSVGTTSYSDSGDTFGFQFNPGASATTAESATCAFSLGNPITVAAYYYTTSVTNQPLSIAFAVQSATDYAFAHFYGTGTVPRIGITTASNCASCVTLQASHWYWVAMQFNAGVGHTMYVWDATDWTFVGSATKTSTDSNPAVGLYIGRPGADGNASTGVWYFDDLVVGSQWPLTPVTPNVNTPTFSAGTGTYNANQSITISELAPSATILYCTDTPGTCTPGTTYSGAVSITATGTHLRSKATATGWNTSAVADATYTIQAVTPTVDNGTGTYTLPVSVTITNPDTALYCTATGANCTPGTAYSAPVSVSVDTTHLCAVNTHTNWVNSATVCFVYTAAATCTTSTDSATGTTNGFDGLSSNAARTYTGGKFTAGSSYTLCKLVLRVDKTGTPNYTLNAYIYTDNSGVPGTLVGTGSGNIATTGIGTSEADVTFASMSAALTSGTVYWIVVKATGSPNDFTNYARLYNKSGSTTTQRSPDAVTWTSDSTFVQVKFTAYK